MNGERRLASVPGLFPRMGPSTAAALFHGVDRGASPPIEAEEWDRDADTIVRQRLAGLALLSVEEGRLHLSPSALARLAEARSIETARCLMIEAAAISAIRALEGAGIPLVVTKGPAVAQAYPDPSLRPFFDVDVLVPPARFEDAFRLLQDLGFAEPSHLVQPRPYFNRWCREGVNLIRLDGGSVDLHHHIPPWVWGQRLSFDAVFARSSIIEISGGSVRAADPVHNLLITALHVISDKGRPGQSLLVWRDLVALAQVCEPGAAIGEADRVRLAWLLSFVLRQLPQAVRPGRLLEGLGRPRIPLTDGARLRLLLPPALGSRHQIAQAFRLPLPEAVSFIVGYSFPSSAFLRTRYGDRGSRFRWWREAMFRLRSARGAAT
jgi:hypothetical protein